MGEAVSSKQRPAGVQILIATDDLAAHRALVPALRGDGHRVVVVHGPMELVWVLDRVEQMPDLLLLDLDMANGAVLKVLDLHEVPLETVPTFLFAGPSGGPWPAKARFDLLRKPVDPDDVRTVAVNLDRWRRARVERAAV